MITKRRGSVVARYRKDHHSDSYSSNKLLKFALWIIWVPIIAVLWIMLLDTSYDWISAPSNIKVVSGLLILILMASVVIVLLVKGAKKLWTW
jgi:hypothetical protein